MSEARYAVYFAPAPDHSLWRWGSSVIGYDAVTGRESCDFDPRLVTRDVWRTWTAEPRRYGFHATLKAPFRLTSGHGESVLVEALYSLAARHRAFSLDVRVARLGPFVALTPPDHPAALAALESDIVSAFEPFRAPLSDAEYRRRRPDRLTPAQRDLLDRFGYPFVGSEFRFHMTLTGALPVEWQPQVADMLTTAHLALPNASSIRVDRLCLFRQAVPEEAFRLIHALSMAD